MSGSLRLIVPGNPPRKDDWLKTITSRKSGKPIRALSQKAKDWTSRLGFVWLQARRPKIERGAWSMHLHIYVKMKTTVGGEVFPFRDCDSSISCVLDAMKREGVIDDDIRIAPILLLRTHDPKDPRTDITLFPPSGDG